MIKKQPIQDEKLWQNFKKGDENAFEDLLQAYYKLLLHYGVRLVFDKELVKDCLHDFFVELWNKRTGLGDVQSLKAYLLISFRRKLLREKEKNNRFKTTNSNLEEYDFDVEFDIETEWIAEEHKQELHQKLKHHLDALTKRQREAIYLRFYQDLDYPQVSEIMAISHPAAVNLVYTAIKMLRQHLTISLFFSLFFS